MIKIETSDFDEKNNFVKKCILCFQKIDTSTVKCQYEKRREALNKAGVSL